MKVHLIDGTYELFRHYHALPKQLGPAGEEVAATLGVLHSVMGLIEAEATHLAVATDHVIESFRNALWPGYKDSSGIEPDLLSQFGLVEEALQALGVVVWPMVEHEADDALAAGARLAASDARVEQVLICTPDKDLAQCVQGERVVLLDRRRRLVTDEAGVVARFGVKPGSIPDYLALVGDSADGYPGLAGWGPRSAAALLGRYEHLEAIPAFEKDWEVRVRGAARLAQTLRQDLERAKLFRRIATVETGAPVSASLDELAYRGPRPELEQLAKKLGAEELWPRATRLPTA